MSRQVSVFSDPDTSIVKILVFFLGMGGWHDRYAAIFTSLPQRVRLLAQMLTESSARDRGSGALSTSIRKRARIASPSHAQLKNVYRPQELWMPPTTKPAFASAIHQAVSLGVAGRIRENSSYAIPSASR